MTLEEIQERVDAIRASKGDDEMAHSYEDSLRDEFIAYVASFDGPLADKARLILTTNEIDFARWCA